MGFFFMAANISVIVEMVGRGTRFFKVRYIWLQMHEGGYRPAVTC